jgi:hypothetical protein
MLERCNDFWSKHVQSVNLQQVRVGVNNIVNKEIVANGAIVLSKLLKNALNALVEFTPFFLLFGCVVLSHDSISYVPENPKNWCAKRSLVVGECQRLVIASCATVEAAENFYHFIIAANAQVG